MNADRPAGRLALRLSRILLLLPAMAAAGCFGYVATEPAALSPGEEVLVRLNSQGALRLSRELGYEVRSLRGIANGIDAEALQISVRSGERYLGVSVDDRRTSHRVELAEIERIETSELRKGRTALLGAGLAVALIATIVKLSGGTGGDGGIVDPPPPPGPTVIPD